MKKIAEYNAKVAAMNAPQKNPSRENIMKQKPLYCTSENPGEASVPSTTQSVQDEGHG